MALVLKDRVRESSITSGTGTLTLLGAVSGFQAFSVIGNTNTTYYAIVDNTTGQFEVGIGTYTLSGTTLSRDTILESSSGGSAINFTGNIKDVFCTYPAEKSVFFDAADAVNIDNLRLDGNTVSSTNSNGNIAITPNGTGEVDISKVDINSGTIDATVIGGATRAAGSFTTLNANGNVTLGDATADTITATGRFNTDLVPSTDNARDLGTAALKWKQVFATTFTENAFPVVSQTDIGTAPNEIPLNQFLGDLAYQDAGAIAGDVVVGGGLTASGPSVISVNSTTNALRITQTGTGNVLLVEDSANPDATPFVINAAGRVMQGVTSTTFPAEFAGAELAMTRATNNGIAFIQYARKARGSIGSESAVLSGDDLFSLQMFGYDGAGYIQAAQILAEVDGTPGTNDMPGRLVFSTTADGASTPTQRMRITQDGHVRLSSNSLGIQFNGDTAAANALDDYEEGIFTPGLTFGGSAAGVTFDRNTGRYTKIGRLVYCQLHIQVSNNGSGTGAAVLTGLPFTVADLFPNSSLEGSGFCSLWSGAGTNCSGFFFNALESTTTAAIEVNPASGTNTAAATDTNVTNSWNVRGLIIYPAT